MIMLSRLGMSAVTAAHITLAVLLFAASARAATVRVENDTLIYHGAADAKDNLSFSPLDPWHGGGPYEWHIYGSTVESGPGCQPPKKLEVLTVVICPPTHSVQIQLGDYGNNQLLLPNAEGWQFKTVTVVGGARHDHIISVAPGAVTTSDGGPGDDDLNTTGDAIGGPGNDSVLAGGDDTVGTSDASGGEGNDHVAGSGVVDGGPGDDVVSGGPTVRLGPGNDTYIVDFATALTRVYGGTGNDLFSSTHACVCELFGGPGDDTFHLVTKLYVKPPSYRAAFAFGGAGRDSAEVDGTDCVRGVEVVEIFKRTSSDARYRCKALARGGQASAEPRTIGLAAPALAVENEIGRYGYFR